VRQDRDLVRREVRASSQGLEGAAARELLGAVAEHGEVGVLAGQGVAQRPGVKQAVGALPGESVQRRRPGGLKRRSARKGLVGPVAKAVKHDEHAFPGHVPSWLPQGNRQRLLLAAC